MRIVDSLYWKASKPFAAKIIEMAKQDRDMIHRACKVSKACGAHPRKLFFDLQSFSQANVEKLVLQVSVISQRINVHESRRLRGCR